MTRAIRRSFVTISAACLIACGSHPATSPSAPSPVPTPTPAPAPAPLRRQHRCRPKDLQLTSTPDALYFYWAPSNQPVRDYWIEVRNGGDLLMAPDIFAQSTGGQPFYRWNTPPAGNYYVIYRTQNDCGLSAPSNIVFVYVQ